VNFDNIRIVLRYTKSFFYKGSVYSCIFIRTHFRFRFYTELFLYLNPILNGYLTSIIFLILYKTFSNNFFTTKMTE